MRGFTLVEMLVVLAITAVLAGLLFPVFAQARSKARQTACINNQKQLVTAWRLYTDDYDGMSPNPGAPGRIYVVDGLQAPARPDNLFFIDLVQPYLRSAQVGFCPSVDRNAVYPPFTSPLGVNGTTYWYNSFAWDGAGEETVQAPAKSPVTFDLPYGNDYGALPHFSGINVSYADSHVRFVHLNDSELTARGGVYYDRMHAFDGQ